MLNTTNLDAVNDEIAVTLLPVIILVFLYMVVGLTGNPFVAYYYGWYVKPSPSYNFITAMAFYDILICGISMPLEIVDLRYSYMFPSKVVCKIYRFLNYFASISSCSILIAIAVDRYMKVCRPFRKQISTRMSKILIGIVCLFALSVSWPAIVFYDVTSINVTSSPGLIGYDCTTSRTENYKIYITLFHGVCFVVFILYFIILLIFYTLIGKTLMKLKKDALSASNTGKSTGISYVPKSRSDIKELRSTRVYAESGQLQTVNNNDNEELQKEFKGQLSATRKADSMNDSKTQYLGKKPESSETDFGHDINSKMKTCIKSDYTDSNTDKMASTPMEKQNQKKSYNQFMHLKMYTFLMLSITVAFVMSFLPYLILVTWRTFAPHVGNLLSGSALVAYEIFIRSWLLSSVLNPFIYGLFNTEFRLFISSVIRRICFCIKPISNTTSRKTNP